ncbi:acyl-CoA dehydrogenase [bacterium]|nr:acyl-CoA dehydrogenase [bacterium]
MSDYRPPLADISFALTDLVDLERLRTIDEYAHIDADLLDSVLSEAGRFMAEVIAPLCRIGDSVGTIRNEDGTLTTPDGYKEAYAMLVEAGWLAAAFPEQWGGGGLPYVAGMAIQEMLTQSDMAFSLCPMLTYAADELLIEHGTEEQQGTYLEKLVTGEWTGTMVLTEAQAGSDVGALTTKAVPQDDGTYRITGTKIFITWGDHDLTDNIIHMVLARTPDSPPGTRGISCFIVPKFLVESDGSIGAANDVTCVSIEHKLGIHGSPTCVLSFGDAGEGSVGYLVGEENQGMRYMFTMMNNARLQVGLEGLAMAQRSYQQAVEYAIERTQGRAIGAPKTESSPIVDHPDVRRMLMQMRANSEAMRGVMYLNGEAIDLATSHPDENVREQASERASILTPISKAWGTDLGVEIASLGIQVHGGMGYVEETGAAQWWRDARIAPIYEGTNGIQAQDLAMRKLPLRGGEAVAELLAEVRSTITDLESADSDLAVIAGPLADATDALDEAGAWLLACMRESPNDGLAGATPYTTMFGTLLGGWVLARGALAAAGTGDFGTAKAATARFYAANMLPTVRGLLSATTAGAADLFVIGPDALAP